MHITRSDAHGLVIVHWRRGAWALVGVAVTLLALFAVVDQTYPRLELRCVRHPVDHRRRLSTPAAVLSPSTASLPTQEQPRWRLLQIQQQQAADDEDVDCLLDKWEWSARPLRDGFLVRHDVDDFELGNVTVQAHLNGAGGTTTVAGDGSVPTTTSPRVEHFVAYSVILGAHSPPRRITMAVYPLASRAYALAGRVQAFLEETNAKRNNELALLIDEGTFRGTLGLSNLSISRSFFCTHIVFVVLFSSYHPYIWLFGVPTVVSAEL